MREKSVSIGGEEYRIAGEERGGVWELVVEGGVERIEVVSVDEDDMVLVVNGRQVVVPYVISGEQVSFVFGGETWDAEVSTGAVRRGRHRDHSMAAPMPGVVLRVFVEEGQQVEKGAPLLILEAMKMEHQLTAPQSGRIAKVNCSEGEMVQPGVDLIEMLPEESG